MTALGARVVGESVIASVPPPADWICFDEFNLTPVVDGVSRHLHLACNALDGKDDKSAACEMRAVAAELRRGAIKAGRRAGAAACIDVKLAHVISWRLASGAAKLNAAAQTIESGRIGGQVELRALIDEPTCADIERRWLVTDEDVWYPVCGEPQRHFGEAIEAYERQDRKTSFTEIQKAIAYLRLEAARASDDAKWALEGAVAGLGKLALSAELVMNQGRESIEGRFADADLALALAHRAKSSEWWARGDQRISGFELKAAARCLEGAAAWAGNEAGASASKVAGETKVLGARLIWGDSVAREEVVRGFVSFGNAVGALGLRINAK